MVFLGVSIWLRHRESPRVRAALGVFAIIGAATVSVAMLARDPNFVVGILVALLMGEFWLCGIMPNTGMVVALGVLIGVMEYAHDGIGIMGLTGGASMAYGIIRYAERSKGSPRSKNEARVVPYVQHVFLCQGKACQTRGADLIYAAMMSQSDFKMRNGVRLNRTECLGQCVEGPLVWIEPSGTLYCRVGPGALRAMVEQVDGRNQP